MNRTFLTLAGCFLGLSIAMENPGAPKFVDLFDGKSLKGWKGDLKLWSVQDGAITGITTEENPLPYNKFLIWDGTLKDFELKIEARFKGVNSGIQYRSEKRNDLGDWVVSGYQADMHRRQGGLDGLPADEPDDRDIEAQTQEPQVAQTRYTA